MSSEALASKRAGRIRFATETRIDFEPFGVAPASFLINRIYTFIENVFCFLAISNFAGAYTCIPSEMSGARTELGEADPLSTAANLVILTGVALLCWIHWRKFFVVASRGLAINLFVLLALVVSRSWWKLV
jgi:hypothetical protein